LAQSDGITAVPNERIVEVLWKNKDGDAEVEFDFCAVQLKRRISRAIYFSGKFLRFGRIVSEREKSHRDSTRFAFLFEVGTLCRLARPMRKTRNGKSKEMIDD